MSMQMTLVIWWRDIDHTVLDKLTVAHLVKKFSAFYATRNLITAFISTRR
jgi:hypothetical protein